MTSTRQKKSHSSNEFFQQSETEKYQAAQLLTFVLQGNADQAKKIFTENPKLLFIEATAKDYAAGIDDKNKKIVPRVIKTTPLRAMAGAGDVWMLEDAVDILAQYTDKNTGESGIALAKTQLALQFPNGFDYPPCTYNFSPLMDAIKKENNIRSRKPSEQIIALLEKFRTDFLPTKITSQDTGHHFNLNLLIAALSMHAAYDSSSDSSDIDIIAVYELEQASLIWCQLYGYFQRLVAANDAQASCQGFVKINDGEPLQRTFNLEKSTNINYYPLEDRPYIVGKYRLGLAFAINSLPSYGGVRTKDCYRVIHSSKKLKDDLKKYMTLKCEKWKKIWEKLNHTHTVSLKK